MLCVSYCSLLVACCSLLFVSSLLLVSCWLSLVIVGCWLLAVASLCLVVCCLSCELYSFDVLLVVVHLFMCSLLAFGCWLLVVWFVFFGGCFVFGVRWSLSLAVS